MTLRAAERETQAREFSHHPDWHLEGERLEGFECHAAGKRVGVASERWGANTTTTAHPAEAGPREAAGWGRDYSPGRVFDGNMSWQEARLQLKPQTQK